MQGDHLAFKTAVIVITEKIVAIEANNPCSYKYNGHNPMQCLCRTGVVFSLVVHFLHAVMKPVCHAKAILYAEIACF